MVRPGAAIACAALGLVAGCSSSPSPETAPTPVPAAEATAPPTAALMAPAAAAGTYRLRTEIQRQGRQRGGRPQAETPLTLTVRPSPAPQMGAPATTFNATVQIPGYTRAPRGRSGQAAGWWPIGGDSVVVQVAVQRGDLMQLRGRLHGTTLLGEVWYLSMQSGATFQLGTFSATRNASR